MNHNHSLQIIVIETTFFVNIYRDWGKTLWEYYSRLGSTTNRFLKLKNLFFIRLQTSSRTCLTRSAKMITVSWSTNWSIERRTLGDQLTYTSAGSWVTSCFYNTEKWIIIIVSLTLTRLAQKMVLVSLILINAQRSLKSLFRLVFNLSTSTRHNLTTRINGTWWK